MERDIYHTNDELKRAGVAILILDKVNFKRKSIIKDKEGHTIMNERVNSSGRRNNNHEHCVPNKRQEERV